MLSDYRVSAFINKITFNNDELPVLKSRTGQSVVMPAFLSRLEYFSTWKFADQSNVANIGKTNFKKVVSCYVLVGEDKLSFVLRYFVVDIIFELIRHQ